MPRTSKGRRSQGPESDTSPESKSGHFSMGQTFRTYGSTQFLLTQLQPEIARCLDCGGTVAISRRDGLTSVTLHSFPPTKDAP